MPDVLLDSGSGAVLVNSDGSALVALSLSAGPSVPAFSADDFTAAALSFLPTGRVWSREPGSVLSRVVAALVLTYARLTSRAAALLGDSPTGSLFERLPEWEDTLGLPDPCAGPSPSLQQRQRSVRAALVARGGQTVLYVQSLLAALGRTGTVIEYAPARVGVMRVGDPVAGPDWAHAWEVVMDPIPAGQDGLVASDAVVACVLRRMQPAHTVLLVTFPGTGDFSAADFGSEFFGGSA